MPPGQSTYYVVTSGVNTETLFRDTNTTVLTTWTQIATQTVVSGSGNSLSSTIPRVELGQFTALVVVGLMFAVAGLLILTRPRILSGTGN